jgi:hypothetical protein
LRIVLTIIAALIVSGTATGNPTVFVSPAELIVDAGEPFEMSIRVDAGYPDSVTAFLVEFTFGAEVIELVSAEEGSLFANCGYPTMYHWDILGPGWHSCNDVTLGHASHVFLPGELVALDFMALAAGETPITVTAVDLRDINRDPILPVYSENGCVTVLPETGVEEPTGPAVPGVGLRLAPNPSPGPIEIEFAVDRGAADVGVAIHDVRGRVVARPCAALPKEGYCSATWNGLTDLGGVLPSGVYFVVVRAGETERRARCVLLR